MSGSTGGGSGGAKETFGAAKKAFKDSKSKEEQGNSNGGQVDDNQEEAGSVQDTAKSSGKGKDGAKKAKDAAKRGKKFFDGLKGIQSLAPLVSALSTIGIALLIIFLIIGFIGFFTTLPGLAMEKFTEACKNFWNWVAGAEKIEISENDLVDLANYIQELGYELVGNGFASKSQITRDENTGEITAVKTDYEGNPGDTPNYLYAYVLQNERMYTLRGVEETGLNKLLSCIPIVGQISDAIEDSIRNSRYISNKSHYGMLYFDELNKEMWNNFDDFEPSIDRENMKLKIKTGFWTVSQMNWDLDGWTGRYGKPIELSLALHLSTMAPDFAYDFCMDDDLQTEVELGSQEVEYTADYTYISNDGLTLTRKEVIDEYNIQMEAINVNANYDALFSSRDKLEAYIYNDEDHYTLPIDIASGVNIVKVYNFDTQEETYYKALDKDGKPIELYNKATNTPRLYEYTVDSGGVPVFTESDDGENLLEISTVNNDGIYGNYQISVEWVSMQDSISVLDYGSDWEKFVILSNLAQEARGDPTMIKNYGLYKFLRDYDECIDYISTEVENISLYQPDGGYIAYYHGDGGKLPQIFDKYGEAVIGGDGYGYFRKRNDVDNLCKGIKEVLIEMTDRINQDKNIVQTNMEPVIAKKTAKLNQWGLDADTFLLLYKVMSSQSTNVHTFKPYINKVTHHWYKDVYFQPDDDDYANVEGLKDFGSAYDFTKEMTDVEGEYNPEGLADTEDIQKLKETGKIMYTLNGTGDNNKDVTQIKQPFIVKTEPWHNKVKNWLTSGYFFIYDSTKETAEEIEAARKVLKDEYDPTDPLLIEYDVVSGMKLNDLNDELLIDSDNNEKPEVAEIDARAKELNDILASTEYKDGKKFKVRLQKINFAKKSSLAAFSILESVHTKDGEYVYRDLKEFMIELGYFTEADFETIESNVLEWIIPNYTPDEWPDKKYEKKNDEYGTYIRSRTSLEAERAEEEKQLGEASKKEEQIADGNTGSSDENTNQSQTENNNTNNQDENKDNNSGNKNQAVSKSAVYQEYAESGEGYQTIITVNGISYRNYKQGDFSDPNKYSYSEGTIATSGCGATSTAIVLTGYGYDVGVPEVANWMTENWKSIKTRPDEKVTEYKYIQNALEHFAGITSQVYTRWKRRYSNLCK